MIKNLFSKKEKSENNNPSNFDFDLDIYWLQRELEFQHQSEECQFRSNEKEHLKFGEIVNSLFDIRKEELSVLTINDGTLHQVEGKDKIWDYQFLSHYKRDENGEYSYYRNGCSDLANQTLLTLSYRRTYDKSEIDKDKSITKVDAMLILHLQYPLGLKEQAMYIQATFCRPTLMLERGKKGMLPQPECLSILIGYDYRPNGELTEEFFSIFNSAKEKINKNKANELNYNENELISLVFHPDIAKEFYFGKKVLAENRYWDAIEYFKNSFKATQEIFWNDNTQFSAANYDFLFECSFLIGFCYMELGLFDKAYKYLEFPSHNNPNYKYQSEFISCLINLKDIRSLNLIEYNFKKLSDKDRTNYNQEEKIADFEFMLFLYRRKSFCLIEFKQYDNAIKCLNKLLELDPTSEFAKQEIGYIEYLKNK